MSPRFWEITKILREGEGRENPFTNFVDRRNELEIRSLKNPVIVVIYLLNLLINDQLQKINGVCQRAVVLNVKHDSHEQERSLDLSLDLRNVDVSGLKKGGNDSLLIELSRQLGLVASLIQFKCTKCFHDDLINACL